MLIVIITVILTVTVGNIELENITVDQIQPLVFAQVNGQVVPAGLLILIYKTSRRSNAVAQCVGDRIACANIFAFVVED